METQFTTHSFPDSDCFFFLKLKDAMEYYSGTVTSIQSVEGIEHDVSDLDSVLLHEYLDPLGHEVLDKALLFLSDTDYLDPSYLLKHILTHYEA